MKTQMQHESQQGVTLIELLIGMALGLLLIGGVITVMVTNSQTARVKSDLDNAQESFRFAAQTISRIVRNGAIANGSGDLTLIVNFDRGPTSPDCLGDTNAGTVTNTFNFFANGELRCNGEVLADGFDTNAADFGFSYGERNADNWLADDDFIEAAEVTNWENVIAVRVELQTESGLGSVLTASSRERILLAYSTSGTGGGNDPPPPPPPPPPADEQDCVIGSTNVSHGSSITAYSISGNKCVSQSRTCSDGNLSGSYTGAICCEQSGKKEDIIYTSSPPGHNDTCKNPGCSKNNCAYIQRTY